MTWMATLLGHSGAITSAVTASFLAFVLLLIQLPAFFLLLSRLLKGIRRTPPIAVGSPTPEELGAVSIVVPTLNERERLGPCLQGLSKQSYEVREIIIVDSNSSDGTPELVEKTQENDPRFRLITDDPLPIDWVGRPWALHTGYLYSSPESEWILGIDADTKPDPRLVVSIVRAAVAHNFDLVSLSPQFILKYPGEWWLQPALLITLVYRFGPTGTNSETPLRVMANGQCFLCRRDVLTKLDGYSTAKGSFCDDVTLARYAASVGFKVGFLDGSKVLKVRMYEGALDTWNGWGRSLDLKDASGVSQLWHDLWFLLCVQGLPLPASLVFLSCLGLGSYSRSIILAAGLNLGLVLIRTAMLKAIAPAYDRTQVSPLGFCLFWLSPLADPLAVVRIFLSALTRPTQWRGRSYN